MLEEVCSRRDLENEINMIKIDNHKFAKESLEREQTYKKTINDLTQRLKSVDGERIFWKEKSE